MIIVWKWSREVVPDGKEKMWPASNSKGDKLYCIAQRPFKDKILASIRNIIETEIPTSHIFVFFHRSGDYGYNQEDLETLLNLVNKNYQAELDTLRRVKCFLFGDNRDYLYLITPGNGLLGVNGQLGGTRDNGEKIVILEKNKDGSKSINQFQFNGVWNYYFHEFKLKIFELYESFMILLFQYSMETSLTKALDLRTAINNFDNGFYYSRLLSLINDPTLDKEQLKHLISMEKKYNKSFVFDDCNANLASIYGENIKTLYKELVASINDNWLRQKKDEIIPSDAIKDVRKAFNKLLEAMPEATFY